ncbi:MAG TPA: DMT family transporter [Candidatus Methylomirabilis sp.]|nr:DMT family transporter [Candidatus Methylomirabilis sp.]
MPAAGQTRAYIALTLVVALWGSYPAFAKLALAHFPPFLLVGLRSVLASAFLTVLLFRRGWDQFRVLGWSDVGKFAFLGFAGLFVSTGGTYLGIAFTTAANAVILQSATPVMVALGARVYLGERLRPVQWAGVALSTAGVLLVITRGSWRAIAHLDLRPGDFLLLFSSLGWSAYTIYGKRVLIEHDPALATTAAYVLGSLMLLPMAFVTAPFFPSPDLASPVAWGVVAYQAFLGAVAHIWWYEAVKEVGPSRSAIFMNLQPVVGILLAWLMLGERITTVEVIGTGAVLAGVALTTRPPAGEAPRPVAAAR